MYRQVLRTAAPVVVSYIVLSALAVSLALVLSSLLAPEGGFTDAQRYIRIAVLGAVTSILVSVVVRYLGGRFVDEATAELRSLPNGGPPLPEGGRRVLLLHWHHGRLDKAAREVFDVLVSDAPDGDPFEAVKAARFLVEGSTR